MQTYVVKFNPRRISSFLTSGTTVNRKNDGTEEIEGTFKERAIPDTATTIAVRKDSHNNRPLINITQEKLDKIVPHFGLIDKDKNEMIKSAKLDFGLDLFWNHPELYLEIKNAGLELSITDDPEMSPKDHFWFDVMKADPLFYVDDGTQRRPETMSEVMFLVVPKYKEEKKISTEFTSLMESRETLRAIVGMSRQRKMFIIDQIGDNLYDPAKSSDIELEDIILSNLDKNRSARLDNGMLFGDFVEAIARQTEDQFSIQETVSYALAKALIIRSGDMYYFDNMPCGNTQKETIQFFNKPENKKSLLSLDLKIKDLKKSVK